MQQEVQYTNNMSMQLHEHMEQQLWSYCSIEESVFHYFVPKYCQCERSMKYPRLVLYCSSSQIDDSFAKHLYSAQTIDQPASFSITSSCVYLVDTLCLIFWNS
jgi:hypothetical protein